MVFKNNNNTYEKNVNILFIYNEGRAKRLNSKKNFPEDFFYFFNLLKKKYPNTDFIEMDPTTDNMVSKFINLLEKIIRKATNLPFYFSQIISKNNLGKILRSNLLVLTNETVGFSTLFMFWFLKSIRKEIKSIVFIMGFFNNLINTNKNSNFKNLILFKFLKLFDTFVFLGKKEYEYANLNFSKFSEKFVYIPFSIDLEFWKNENDNLIPKKYILFVGNDQNRDFKLLKQIANLLPEEKFIFVTNSDYFNLPENVTLISGSWRTEIITDNDFKKLYMSSWLSIIPLKESLQPSGQSVALQSMSMNIPVMITYTEGFWEEHLFVDEKNIFFIKNGLNEWVSKIKNLEKRNDLNVVTDNAYKTVKEHFNLNNNFEYFEELVTRFLK